MTGVRGDRATPGEFRRTQNWVGPAGATPETASYVPPPPEELMACLGPWEKFLHERALPPLVHVALAHYQFEAIHPFLDGNGRVGRLLITLSMIERGVLPAPLLYLSAYFEATRSEYYARLRAIQEGAAWESWIRYFLDGVARQSEDALRRAEQINSLLAGWRRRLADAPSPAAVQLVDLLAENPYWTVRRAASRLGVAFTTAQRAVERLRAASIVTQVGEGRRDRVYCAIDLLRILEAPSASARPRSHP
jgi:Fic family protein